MNYDLKMAYDFVDLLVEENRVSDLSKLGHTISSEVTLTIEQLKETYSKYDALCKDLKSYYRSFDNLEDPGADMSEYFLSDEVSCFSWKTYQDSNLDIKLFFSPDIKPEQTLKEYFNDCFSFWTSFYFETHLKPLQKELSQLRTLRNFISNLYLSLTTPEIKTDYFEFRLKYNRAKNYPIRDALALCGINTDKKMIKCFHHSENTASMHIYNDSVYCFGCHSFFDSIGIIMELKNKTFKEAVDILNI